MTTDLASTLDTAGNIDAVADLARAGTIPHNLALGSYYVVQGGDGQVTEIDLTGERHNPTIRPRRIKQTVQLDHTDSLLDYWSKHAGQTSELYANRTDRTITAIIDAHDVAGANPDVRPDWQGHRAVLTLAHHDALRAWMGCDGKLLEQEAFVDFLDEHSLWIADPAPAVLVGIVRELRGSVGGEFEMTYDPATGSRTAAFSKQIKTKTVSGEIDLPESFTLRLPAWRGATDTVDIAAKLRIRIPQDRLHIGYKLINLTELVDSAFAAEVARIGSETGTQVWYGSAPREASV
jgi:uncharacterized protein YfdQ (DUF2303 family)